MDNLTTKPRKKRMNKPKLKIDDVIIKEPKQGRPKNPKITYEFNIDDIPKDGIINFNDE